MSEILIILAAFFASVIDTSLGMCYGTILTPSLIIAGYSPTIVVPAVLFSQLVVDIAGGAAHTKVKNFTKRDIKVALLYKPYRALNQKFFRKVLAYLG